MNDGHRWTDVFGRTEGVKAVYKDRVPPLSGTTMEEVRISPIGILWLRVNLSDFPDEPPAKWAAQGFDTVQLTLAFTEIRHLAVSGMLLPDTGGIDVLGTRERGVAIDAKFGEFHLEATAAFASITKVSAYLNAGE